MLFKKVHFEAQTHEEKSVICRELPDGFFCTGVVQFINHDNHA